MKLGDRVFYELEGKRQKYLGGMEALPYAGATVGFLFFIGFALLTPMHSKLYKEAVYSMGMGTAVAALWPYYYRKQYLKSVEQVYEQLVARFERFPHLNKPDHDDSVKNFGFNKWNDEMFESEEDIEIVEAVGVFDGDADDDRKIMK